MPYPGIAPETLNHGCIDRSAGRRAMLEQLEQQRSLTTNQWKICAAATIGDMLDFFDFYLIGFILAFVVKGWSLTYGQSGAILLSSGIAAPLGSLFWGWLADKIGRRKVMILTVLNFSIPTGLMALTPEQGWLFLTVEPRYPKPDKKPAHRSWSW
jgi:MFS transporter, putative metabolite:H+ symporter